MTRRRPPQRARYRRGPAAELHDIPVGRHLASALLPGNGWGGGTGRSGM